MRRSIYTFFTALLNLITPPRSTERLVSTLTRAELQEITLRGPRSGMLPYSDPRVRALVWEVKYYRNPRALELAAELLAEEILSLSVEDIGLPLLIPVPMHSARRRERGHNQTELLCEAVLPRLAGAVEYAPEALKRVLERPPQQKLNKVERAKNPLGSMEATAAVKGRRCIVVDDVQTTGATLAEAARALRSAGASTVSLVALAHS